ncbi:MAG: TRAP transporter TatT component family protein [Candidatus Bipolaricaulia bacterium]
MGVYPISRIPWPVLPMLLLILIPAWAMAVEQAEPIAQGDAAYRDRHIEARLREAIAIYEAALKQEPGNRYLLNRLSKAYYELAAFHLQDREAQERVLDQGKEYGMRSLRSDPEFAQVEADEGFREAVRGADDVEALFWTATNWGRLLQFRGVFRSLRTLPTLRTMWERSLELDETYFAGGIHRVYGAYYAELPRLFGRDLERAREHFVRALELDPGFLGNYTMYARYYATAADNQALFEALLHRALRAPINDRYPLHDRLAKREATEFLTMEDEWF